jgi:hypothetical protein
MPDPTYEDVLGQWIAQYAENVQDMGRRVAEVLGGDPRDHHYAASKLSSAVTDAVKALTLAGLTEQELIELVSFAHDDGRRYKQDLRREFDSYAQADNG